MSDPADLVRAIEALIFAANRPVSADRLVAIIGEVTGETPPTSAAVEAVVLHLNACYDEQGHPFRIQHWAGGYRMMTTEAVTPYLNALFRRDRRKRLTRPLMETLAILCYRQPATKQEVDHVRGVDSGYAIRRLMSIGLVDVAGRSEVIGRPMLYRTTDRFLEAFGLANLDALPNLREIEELLDDPGFDREKARLLMFKSAS